MQRASLSVSEHAENPRCSGAQGGVDSWLSFIANCPKASRLRGPTTSAHAVSTRCSEHSLAFRVPMCPCRATCLSICLTMVVRCLINALILFPCCGSFFRYACVCLSLKIASWIASNSASSLHPVWLSRKIDLLPRNRSGINRKKKKDGKCPCK